MIFYHATLVRRSRGPNPIAESTTIPLRNLAAMSLGKNAKVRINLPLQEAAKEIGHMLNMLQNDHDAPNEETLLLLEKNLTLFVSSSYTVDAWPVRKT